jgi:hypothetical protein
MLKPFLALSFLIFSLSAMADNSESFAGLVRCQAYVQKQDLAKGSVSSSKRFELTLTKKGYNSWSNDEEVTVELGDLYKLTLKTVSASATRVNPQEMRLRYSGSLIKSNFRSSNVVAVGSSEGSFTSMNLSSTEEAQAYLTAKNMASSPEELIKGNYISDDYVTQANVACSMVYNK